VGYCVPYSEDQLASYQSQASTSTALIGEFTALYQPLQTCEALDAYSQTYRPQSIGIPPVPATVGTELQAEGCGSSFYNKVGTRIVLDNAVITGNPIPGGQLALTLTLTNAGYGRVLRARPVTVVLIQNQQAFAQIPIPLQDVDLRTLHSFASGTFQTNITLPSALQGGPLSVALWIPDPGPSLASQPVYALPLNSVDQASQPIFDVNTVYNYVAASAPTLMPAFQLVQSGVVTSNPAEVVDGAYSVKGINVSSSPAPFLKTNPAAFSFTPNHTYTIAFKYKILTAPSNNFQLVIQSFSGGFLPGLGIAGNAGTTGTGTLTRTLGPYTDYFASWSIAGIGAISIDDIQITDVTAGTVVAAANAEPSLPSPLTVACQYGLSSNGEAFSAQGGQLTISIIADPGCAWSVSNLPSWVTIQGASFGVGSGSITLTVQPTQRRAGRPY
jgi:hypothetical protein